MKKCISVILAFLMVFGLFTVQASAADNKVVQYGKVEKISGKTDEYYGGVSIIGDSVSRGCGASGVDPSEDNTYYSIDTRIVPDSYSYLLSQALGCDVVDAIECGEKGYFSVADVNSLLAASADSDEKTKGNTYWPICSPGQTLSVTMEWLGIDDDGYDDDAEYRKRFNDLYEKDMISFYFKQDPDAGNKSAAQRMIETSSLIVVELGMNDVFTKATLAIKQKEDLSTVELVQKIIADMYSGYSYWAKYYPIFIQKLQEWNPDADIVLVGYYNSLFNTTLSEDSVIPLGNAFSLLSSNMNTKLKYWASKYDCTYVDISNVETGAESNDNLTLSRYMLNMLLNTHPSTEGYKYIYRQVLNALPTTEERKSAFSLDVDIDLGSIDNVKEVTLSGIGDAECDWDFDETTHTLSIYNLSPFTTKVKVTYDTEEKITGRVSYRLVLGFKGFTPYRIYSTNNLNETLEKVNASLNTFKQTIFGILSIFAIFA